MIRIEETVSLARPSDEVFGYLADFRNLPRWDPGILSATLTTTGALAVGSRFDVVASFMGRRVPMKYRMARFDPEARVAELVGEADTLDATDRISVAPEGAGSRVTWQADFELRGASRHAAWLFRPLFARLGRKAMDGMRVALR